VCSFRSSIRFSSRGRSSRRRSRSRRTLAATTRAWGNHIASFSLFSAFWPPGYVGSLSPPSSRGMPGVSSPVRHHRLPEKNPAEWKGPGRILLDGSGRPRPPIRKGRIRIVLSLIGSGRRINGISRAAEMHFSKANCLPFASSLRREELRTQVRSPPPFFSEGWLVFVRHFPRSSLRPSVRPSPRSPHSAAKDAKPPTTTATTKASSLLRP